MLPFEQIKPALLLFVGQREAARRSLQETYRASDEQTAQLMAALEQELPLLQLGPRKIAQYAGGGLTILGLILVGVGLAGYFSLAEAASNWDHAPCTVKSLSADGTSVTFVYEYQGKSYSIRDVSDLWLTLKLREGQRLDMLVNPLDPNDVRLPIAKPILQRTSLNLSIVGAVMVAFAVVLWFLTRSS